MKTENAISCECGSIEFVVKANCIEIFELVNGCLVYKRTENAGYELPFMCSECGNILLDGDKIPKY